jgi:hypothetical protein
MLPPDVNLVSALLLVAMVCFDLLLFVNWESALLRVLLPPPPPLLEMLLL